METKSQGDHFRIFSRGLELLAPALLMTVLPRVNQHHFIFTHSNRLHTGRKTHTPTESYTQAAVIQCRPLIG